MSASINEPDGWLHCNGRLLYIDSYPDLYDAIGLTYTKISRTASFQIPDLRGRVGVGSYEGVSDATYSLTQRSRGDISGAETHTLSINEMPAHTHSYLGVQGQDAGTMGSNTSVAENDPRPTETSGSTGGGAAHNNMQPYVVVRYLIKY
jgi:microcystin-dependent protein